MEQDVGVVHGDNPEFHIHGNNHEFHLELRRSLVQLVSYHPEGRVFTVPAIPIVSVNGFCSMITLSKVFRQRDAPNWQHQIFFPDGTRVMLRLEDIIIQEHQPLAAFSVNTAAELPNPVIFSEQQVSRNQEVYTVSYEGLRGPSVLVRGRVTHVGQGMFFHDCAPGLFTSFGSPVFNEERQLVGICYCDHGVTGANNMNQIAELLSEMNEGMANMSLSQIVHHLEVRNQGN